MPDRHHRNQLNSNRNLLLSTGNAMIVEHTANDSYWGDGGDGSGLNMLGKVLMEIRNELRADKKSAPLFKGPDIVSRQISYFRHEFRLSPSPRKNTMLAFLYDIPYFGACGIFPPFHLLNELLRSGGCDGGMGPGATWSPFELSQQEYNDIISSLPTVDIAAIRATSRFAHFRFEVDPSFDHITDYRSWMLAVCEKHRASWKMKRGRI
jgi:hypothetical protein